MTRLEDLKLHPPKILLMGQFGTGKTALATTLGPLAEVIDLDNGLRTAVTLQDEFTHLRKEIDIKVCWEEDPSKAVAFRRARSHLDEIVRQCLAKKYKKKALIIDGYTALADGSVRDVLVGSGGVDRTPQIQHWGLAFRQLEEFLIRLKALPIVVIVIAHLRRISDGDTSIYELGTPGQKLPQKIPTYFDEVWCAKIRGKNYVLQTKGTSALACRTRSGLEDMTDQNLGMVGVLKNLGYDIEKEDSPFSQREKEIEKERKEKEEKKNARKEDNK